MSIGSISSLGLGSGLDLQGILDKLRAVDETTITAKKDKRTDLETRLSELGVVSSKLLTMKSHALSLSLSSNFLERTTSVSDESVLTATAIPGSTVTNHSLEVTRLASKSSWQSTGVSGSSASVYVPTTQESTTGFADTNTTAAVSADEMMMITFGSGDSQQWINVDLTSGMTLDQVANAINTDSQNSDGAGGTLVTTEIFIGTDGNNYLRLKSTAEGTGEDNRVMVMAAPTGLSFSAPEKTLQYHLGAGGDKLSLSVAADTTMAQLADLINDDENNPGITASVIDDGSGATPYRLVLTANATGEDGRITVDSQLDDLGLSELQGAQGASLNAQITADGVTYQRQSNSGIGNVVQGLSLNLNGVGTSTVTVTADTETVKSDIMGLVEAFGTLVEEINANDTYDQDTEEWGTLALTSVPGLKQQVASWLSTIVKTGGSITSLFDLGLSFDRDGSITMDESVLTSALSSNFEDVTKFFTGDEEAGITGFATTLNDRLREQTSSTVGVVGTEKGATQSQIDRLNDDIEKSTDRLDKRYEIMAKRFVELDVYMSKMESQSNYIGSLIDAFNGSKDK